MENKKQIHVICPKCGAEVFVYDERLTVFATSAMCRKCKTHLKYNPKTDTVQQLTSAPPRQSSSGKRF